MRCLEYECNLLNITPVCRAASATAAKDPLIGVSYAGLMNVY